MDIFLTVLMSRTGYLLPRGEMCVNDADLVS